MTVYDSQAGFTHEVQDAGEFRKNSYQVSEIQMQKILIFLDNSVCADLAYSS